MKYTFTKLSKIDKETDKCVLRQLDMAVSATITSPGYGIQFWKDVSLYGVDEAILFVKNGNHGDWQNLQAEWEKVKAEIETAKV